MKNPIPIQRMRMIASTKNRDSPDRKELVRGKFFFK